MRLIDADVLLEKVREIRKLALDRAVETPANMPFPIYQNPAYTRYSTQADERERFIVMIEKAPSVQPERKTGRWIPCPQSASWLYVYKCSECGGYLQISDVDGKGYKANYCSYCGARMERGEQE